MGSREWGSQVSVSASKSERVVLLGDWSLWVGGELLHQVSDFKYLKIFKSDGKVEHCFQFTIQSTLQSLPMAVTSR